MASAEKYLRPEVIRQVARLDLRAKFIVEGFLTGLHASPFQGFSVEFSEHRKYVPGDDLKVLDWNVYAKTDRYYIKKVAIPVLRHRISTNFQAQAEGKTSEDIIQQLLATVSEPEPPKYEKRKK